MNFSLQGLFTWMQTQAQYALFIVLLIVILYFAAKRAWIGMIGAIFGLALVGIFIIKPDVIKSLAEWLGQKLNLSMVFPLITHYSSVIFPFISH